MLRKNRIKIALLLFTNLFISGCFQDSTLNKMELENAVLNQCDYIHTVLRNEFQIYAEDKEYVNACGCVSTIVSDDLMESKNDKEIKVLFTNPAKLVKSIRHVMLKNRKKISSTCGDKESLKSE